MIQGDFLKTEEAAKYLCVSLSKLWKMCHKKELSYYKMGRLNLFRKEELLEFIEKNKVMTVGELKMVAEKKLLSMASKIK